MTERSDDPNAWIDAYRENLAPVYKAQQESLKTFARFARFQHAVLGDLIDASISHAQAALTAKNPLDLAVKQVELGSQIGDKLRGRAQEFSTLASEAQGTVANFADLVSETASRARGDAKKAA
ncbi:MAG TPA: phasin family protein [Steroidobacteraceae bacterium]|nr:phasin family protein [Steroidobacteraceae bacterium]